jgi:hypothetical protein
MANVVLTLSIQIRLFFSVLCDWTELVGTCILIQMDTQLIKQFDCYSAFLVPSPHRSHFFAFCFFAVVPLKKYPVNARGQVHEKRERDKKPNRKINKREKERKVE